MPPMEALTYTIAETAQLLGISKTSAYLWARQGKLPTLKIGGRRIVPRAALNRMLEGAKCTES